MPDCVVIAGGSGGLGRAAAAYFAEKGYTVVSLDIRASGATPDGVVEIETDLTDSASVERACAEVGRLTDGVSAVVSLAGLYAMQSLVEVPETQLQRIFDVNFFGVYRLNRIFLPLVRRGNGRFIIVTSELAGMKALPFNGIYSLTKTALQHYADSLRQELALLGVPVIEILPGAFDTGMIGSSFRSLDSMSGTTALYRTNTERFRRVMQTQSGTARPPRVLAQTIYRAATARHPRLRYRPNNNALLWLFNLIPRRAQVALISLLLKR